MSKKTIQSRKFLEQQVKLMLNEQSYEDYDIDSVTGEPAAVAQDFIDSLEPKPAWVQGLYEPFVAIGNQIINKLYGGNFEQAIGSLNYDKEAGSKKNFEDLRSVKDFFILFSEPNLADQQLGLKDMGDYLDPKFAKPSKYLKKYLSFINTKLVPKWNQIKKNKNQRFSAELYSDLYRSIYSSAPKTRGSVLFSMRGTPAGQHSTITNRKTLKEKNFFNIAAKLRMPFAQFALLCLRPFQELISNVSSMYEQEQITTVGELSSQGNIMDLLSSYKNYFVKSLNSKDKEILKNTFLAFSVAKMVDPSGGTPLDQWYQIISKDPPKVKIGGKSLGYEVAYLVTDWTLIGAEYRALQSILQRTIKKRVKLLSWWTVAFAAFYIIDPLKYLDTGSPVSLPDSSPDSLKLFKAKIPGAIDKTLKVISDLEKTKPKDGDWFFTTEENEAWRREFSEIEKVLKKELETGAAIRVLDSAAKKYKTWKNIQGSFKEMFTLMRMYLQFEINKDNIEESKQALKGSKNLMIDFYNQVRIPDTSFIFHVKAPDLGSETNESMKTTITNRKQLSSIVSKILLEQGEEVEIRHMTAAEKQADNEAAEKAKRAEHEKQIDAVRRKAGEVRKEMLKTDGDLYEFLEKGWRTYAVKHVSSELQKDIPTKVREEYPIINKKIIEDHGLTGYNVSEKLKNAQGLWKKANGAEDKLTMDSLTKEFSKKYEQIFPTSLRKSLSARFRRDHGLGPDDYLSIFRPGKDGFTPHASRVGLYHEIESLDVLDLKQSQGGTQDSFPIYCYFAPRLYEGDPNSSVFMLTDDPGEAREVLYRQSLRDDEYANHKGSVSKIMRIDSLDKLFPMYTLSQRAELHRLQYEKAIFVGTGFDLSSYVKNYKRFMTGAKDDKVEMQYITAMRDYVLFLAEMTATADYLGKIGEANQEVAKLLANEASKEGAVLNERLAAATMMVHLEKLSIIDKAFKDGGLKDVLIIEVPKEDK